MIALLDLLTELLAPICAVGTSRGAVFVVGYDTWCALDTESEPCSVEGIAPGA